MAHRTPHPLSSLTEAETKQARDIILRSSPAEVIQFRMIFREEPEKALLVPFLALEHSGKLLPDSPRPPRLAAVHYVRAHQAPDRKADEVEATVDLNRGQVVKKTVVGTEFLAGLSTSVPLPPLLFVEHGNELTAGRWEFDILVDKCKNSKLFQDRIAQFRLPEGFDVVIEPWPYGGMDQPGNVRRYFQGLVYAIDTRSQNPDSNFYAYPLPVIPVMDFEKREIVRIDELATGGAGDSLIPLGPRTGSIIDHCEPAEYVPELLPRGTRKDLKPLSVIQPEGPSFAVTDESLIEWQKWRFRVSFNPREGAVIHDVHFDGRSVLYRLSISEMVRAFAAHVFRTSLTITDCPICGSSPTFPAKTGVRLRRWRHRTCSE
jgi:primary-amine oxidase